LPNEGAHVDLIFCESEAPNMLGEFVAPENRKEQALDLVRLMFREY
jgi:hypothetical protein